MKVLFLDLETTDFSPTRGEILECYAQSYNVATGQRGNAFGAVINWPRYVLDTAWSVHEFNGLLQDSEQSTLGYLEFKARLLNFFDEEFGNSSLIRIAGFSPHFDQKWLIDKLGAGNRLAHRVLDISTIRDWFTAIGSGGLLPSSHKNDMKHRAKDDVEVAIKTLEIARTLLPTAAQRAAFLDSFANQEGN